MKIIEVQNYDQMSQQAAKIIIETVQDRPQTVLGLATGGTPLGTYTYLVRDHQLNGTSYKQVHTVNLDEYVGKAPSDEQSYSYYMNKHLFEPANIPKTQTYLPNGLAANLEEEAERYTHTLQSLGGVDLQLLGIGKNGHIGFNEPGTSFDSETHVVQLTPSTRQANAKYFSSESEVPTQAITLGIATIMKAKRILLIVSGIEKAEILYQCLYGQIDEQIPASILQKHPHVTIIADQEALSVVNQKAEAH
ncbi:glucosamine-6-phosphate deaminase [Alkalicoccobacillus porphyridii]|uniref:Glucosamine-6-phosphate deaminase n=1 Tax=Alkalicoccobacillus porphyridii TaxID=2597270 RepID=A0A554A129_9BACI|nr:glucosamine-6-phosphate deaminase [Alkalicoccobacillus porphyridii]TSB47346.1 glucosamine-6-phosphate deaminase [Alkalicoccobacillus porphyridii]